MEKLIEQYVDASKSVLSAKEMKGNYSLIPIMEDGEEIGFFALQFSNLEKLGQLAIVEAVYLDPDHKGRGLRFYLPQLFMSLQDMGIEWIQGNAEPVIAKFLERRYDIKPQSMRYLEPIQKLTGRIN